MNRRLYIQQHVKKVKTVGGTMVEAEYQALLDVWTNQPDATNLAAQNLLMRAFKDANFLQNVDFLYFPAIHTNADDEHKFNWADPSKWKMTLVTGSSGEATFAANEGITGNGVDIAYWAGTFEPQSNAIKATIDSVSIGSFIRTVAVPSGPDASIGGGNNTDGSFTIIYPYYATNSSRIYGPLCTTSTYFPVADMGSADPGLRSIWANPNASGNVQLAYDEAGDEVSMDLTSAGYDDPLVLPGNRLAILAAVSSKTPNAIQHCSHQLTMAFFGGDYDQTKHVAVQAAIETYLDTFGKGVFA